MTEEIVVTETRCTIVSKIKENLRVLDGGSMEADQVFTIFRAPTYIRQKNKELYEPRMVSIGPYYHGKESLQAIEKLKWRYLQDFLSRNSKNSIESCIDVLREFEPRARKCYFEEVKHTGDDFLMMLLLDGCFIIEFLIKWYYRIEDTLSDVAWALPIIRSDLLLLENQIPFFIIQELFDLLRNTELITSRSGTSTNPKIKPLLSILIPYLSEGKEKYPVLILTEIQHILHLYHLCYVPVLPNLNKSKLPTLFTGIQSLLNPIKVIYTILIFVKKMCLSKHIPVSSRRRAPQTIPSATMLHEAGITFQCKNTENILDVTFGNGTLQIPSISIQDTRRSRLLNLVFFEQCSGKAEKNLTSYAGFMGGLIRTTHDVELLQRKQIVDNLLANEEELVLFFNWLTECSYMDYENHYLKDVFIEVNKYYESDWHRWRGNLKRNYFSNPWSIISVAAAVVLLIFTGLQTFFTIYPYYHNRQN
jgi:Plant protein of unknown function